MSPITMSGATGNMAGKIVSVHLFALVRGSLARTATLMLRKTQVQPLYGSPRPRLLSVRPPAHHRPPHGRQLPLRQRRLHPLPPPPPGVRRPPTIPAGYPVAPRHASKK